MKVLAIALFVAVAAAYYFGYEPLDFIPSFPSNTPPHKVRHAPAPTEETQNPAPARTTSSNVVAQAPDGALADRWKP